MIDFPNSPSLNEIFFAAGRTWRYNGSSWESYYQSDIGPSGATGATGAGGGAIGSIGLTGVNGSKVKKLEVFTSTATWTKEDGAVLVEAILVGGGGGGGAGGKVPNPPTISRNAGRGGAGGGYYRVQYPAAYLKKQEVVTVGLGGTGNPRQTVNNTTTTGTAQSGGNTTFGPLGSALGGPGSGIGLIGGASSVWFETSTGGSGAGGNISTPSNGGPFINAFRNSGAGGGGGGGGILQTGGVVTTMSAIIGTGGAQFGYGQVVTPGPTVEGENGQNGVDSSVALFGVPIFGTGGAGGAANTTGDGGNGGNGGYPGGGGGGGGTAFNDIGNSGAGGNGANGIAIIITHF
jgi:hypothetical protein